MLCTGVAFKGSFNLFFFALWPTLAISTQSSVKAAVDARVSWRDQCVCELHRLGGHVCACDYEGQKDKIDRGRSGR